MISCLLCSRCRLFFNNIYGLKHIAQPSIFNNSQAVLTNNYCNNVKDALPISASFQNTTSNAFSTIYRFPGIRLGFVLHKLKWKQSILAAVAIPSSLILYYCGLIDSTWTICVLVSGVSLSLNLYGTAVLFQNAIGFLYLSEDGTTLKISYLDFWGKRVDEEFPVEDVVPLLDAPRPPTDYLYKQIVFFSTDKKKLKLFLKFGEITDQDKFGKVFGPLD